MRTRLLVTVLQCVETPRDFLGVSNTTETLEQKKTTSWKTAVAAGGLCPQDPLDINSFTKHLTSNLMIDISKKEKYAEN